MVRRITGLDRIRNEVIRVFGRDEVISFLKRLIRLGFIKPIPKLEEISVPAERMIKEFNASDVQFRLSQALVPWYCLWELNTICDLRCKTCYLPNFDSKGPDASKALDIADEIIDNGIFYVGLMGGEALLRDDLEKIIEKLRNSGVFVKLISNGQGLSLERAKRLAVAGINQIEISFDGLSAQTHDMSCGKGTFIRAVQAIKNIRESGIHRAGIVWTVHTDNIAELELLPKFMHDLDVRECYLSLFKKVGKLGTEAEFNPLDGNAILNIYKYIDTWKKAYPQLTIVLNSKCSCGRTSLVIGYNGEVRLCSFLYNSMGNIYHQSLDSIWQSIKTDVLRDVPLGYCANL